MRTHFYPALLGSLRGPAPIPLSPPCSCPVRSYTATVRWTLRVGAGGRADGVVPGRAGTRGAVSGSHGLELLHTSSSVGQRNQFPPRAPGVLRGGVGSELGLPLPVDLPSDPPELSLGWGLLASLAGASKHFSSTFRALFTART